ncbi:MAG TPA: acetyl ornithine aminotransferase family protein [Gemmatimonadaceae bacterium]|nr:acetyl ornithine aminotransferase family protein [Gemmatimonadaceae bacterium]
MHDYPRIITPPPGPKAAAIVAKDAEYTSTCYIKEYPLVIARGERAMVEDVDGNRFLDFMAGIAVSSTGYGHPKVVAAVKDAADRFLHICGSDFYFAGMADLCERLAKLAPGKSKKRVFLSNSGTESVDGAIKLARNSTRRPGIIAFKGAFHGRSYGGMSLTSRSVKQRAHFGPLVPEVYHLPYGYEYRCDYRRDCQCDLTCVSQIEKEFFQRHAAPDDIAAIFVEPIQGEGGYVVPPPGYLRALRELCDRHGILLVFDEIQSGIGRTGKMFACEWEEGVEPDILLTAKGLGSGMPIGAIIARESITRWESGAHGSTFGGNPVCCAAALATLDLVEGGLMQNAAAMGERLMAGVKQLQAKHAMIGDVRGRGLMVGVELVKDRATREPFPEAIKPIEEMAFRKGLLVLGAGKNALRLAPPLVIDAEDVDIALRILDECLAAAR